MSKKPGLAKKITHTLMAMSIIYSSGINVVVNEVYAQEIITSGNKTIEKSGDPGHNYAAAGGITDGESIEVNGVIDSSSNLSAADNIEVKATGGDGGNDNGNSPTVDQGSNGGDAVAKITIDESLSSVALGKLTVTAYGGANGSTYQGTAGTAGAATAYGLQLKHDLSISVADIYVKAETRNSEKNTVVNNNTRPQALAVGVQFDGGKVSFTGTTMSVSVRGVSGSSVLVDGTTITADLDGVAVESYGFRVQDGEATIRMTDKISFSDTFGGAGDSLAGVVGSGVTGGNGGEMTVFGVEVNGGIAHLDLLDIGIDPSNYFSGGNGGSGQSIDGTAADRAGTGGEGGKATVAGIHTAGGSVDGTVGQIKLLVTGGQGDEGGKVKNIQKIGGSGGKGGAAYIAGIKADAGQLQLAVAGMDIKAVGGSGGNVGNLEGNSHNVGYPITVTATGTQKSGGTGGAAFTAGVDNRGGSSDVTVTGLVKVTASGGVGGGANFDSGTVVDNDGMDVIKAEYISGAGGMATAAGLQNTAGTLTAAVQKLEITAAGGHGAYGISTYAYAGVDGGLGGAAAAYGINVAGGLVESITATEIAVTGTGGAGGDGGNGRKECSTDGSSTVGGNGGNGAAGTAYGVGNSGGLLKNLSADSIAAAAIGGNGGRGGKVFKGITDIAGGTGGNGGNGGNAYAYGVWGSGKAAVTAVAADTVTATATAGDAGLGAAADSSDNSNDVATPGTAGTKGEEAKAYGIYADQGAVIELGEKTTGSGITIGAQATNGETANEAYAVYAGNGGTVLFRTDAVLNGDGSGGTDNDVVTALADGTLGFSGTSADRSVTGGALRLTGSNEFRVTTDLANNKADNFEFNSLAAGSSTEAQYITIGYDKAFDGSSLSSINGDVTVLTVNTLTAGQNLDNFVGKKTTLDNPLERFTATPTVVTNGKNVKITQIDFAKNTDGNSASETAMTLSDAQMAMGSMWRIEGNNLMKRMGELRSDKEAAKGGVWARYYRGELSADSAYDRNFSQDYTAFQGGIDKVQDFKGGKLYTGIAVNRIDSNAGYTAGSGDLSSTGVGLYASWLGGKGHYLDVIARGSKLTNDFKLVDLSGNSAKADYDTWAYGISAEYGYRQELKAGWFVEPQAEVSLGHMGSADYTTSNGVSVKQDSVNSAVTRVGIMGGKEFNIGGRPSNAYVKASLLHDFGGNGGATGYYGDSSLALKTGDLTGTWYEIGLGANLGIARNSNLYFDALKTFNGSIRTDWQINAGFRFSF